MARKPSTNPLDVPRTIVGTTGDTGGANGIDGVTGGDGGIAPDPVVFDPAAFVGTAGTGGAGTGAATGGSGRKRGRPAGSGTGAKKPKSSVHVNGADGVRFSDVVESALIGIHTILHAITKVPELEMSQEEAASVAAATEKVMAFYPDVRPKGGETVAWINLAMVIGTVYGQRAVAFKMRKDLERTENAAPEMPVNGFVGQM